MTDFGRDFDVREDFTPSYRVTDGLTLVKNACFHRVTTKQVMGNTDAAILYGIDLREKLGSVESDIARDCDEAVQRDPRVLDSTHVVTRIVSDGDKVELRIEQQVDTAFGPFDRVLLVNALTVEILEGA